MATFAREFSSLSHQPAPDPDIQSALSDFLTYTEHFPSHLTRALTLIGDQRLKSERSIKAIHNGTTQYALLPTLTGNRLDPVKLRRDISYALEEAERASRMAVEEATRLDEMCDREAKRLDIVTEKLKAAPMPPSRDPTPEQQALTSPNVKKVGTRADDLRDKQPKRHHQDSKAASKLRGRKIMVPGEVLPPPDPNAPPSSMSDWTSPRVSPPVEEAPQQPPIPTLKLALPPRPRSRTPKVPKIRKDSGDEKTPKSRGPRQPGQPGTNAHSAIAGISTSNALLALKAPPEDAPKGSKWLPWLKLTEWEMAKLRKRMKKNAIWVPSQTMVRRELKNLGRGIAGKEAARARAEEGEAKFVDEANEQDPTKVEVTGEEAAQMNEMLGPQMIPDDDDADAALINRGMRLNEAKKLKRQRMLEEQAALNAQIAREQGSDAVPVPESKADGKKRKRETTPDGIASPDPLSRPGPVPKKLKVLAPSSPGKKVPLAPAGPSSSPRPTSSRAGRKAATPPVNRKPTITIKVAKAVSEEPPNKRASLRRGSNASLPSSTIAALTSPSRVNINKSRRSKRPPPGQITNGDEESARLAGSKRKTAPKKKGAGQPVEMNVPEDYIDPLEERYCVCGDVSWGIMIACDNEDSCEKEWFHLPCVGLDEMPPRRTKWYCPDCRKKLKLGQSTNGLVGRGTK